MRAAAWSEFRSRSAALSATSLSAVAARARRGRDAREVYPFNETAIAAAVRVQRWFRRRLLAPVLAALDSSVIRHTATCFPAWHVVVSVVLAPLVPGDPPLTEDDDEKRDDDSHGDGDGGGDIQYPLVHLASLLLPQCVSLAHVPTVLAALARRRPLLFPLLSVTPLAAAAVEGHASGDLALQTPSGRCGDGVSPPSVGFEVPDSDGLVRGRRDNCPKCRPCLPCARHRRVTLTVTSAGWSELS